MVGHTSVMEAAVKAVETVDSCIGRLFSPAMSSGYHVVFTADHGNSESMWDPVRQMPLTAHTTNPVPFIYTGPGIGKSHVMRTDLASLADVGPTILTQMEVPLPAVMAGRSLFDTDR